MVDPKHPQAAIVPGFPDYLVNELGEFYNERLSFRPVNYSQTRTGLPKINLHIDRILYTRSPAKIVAECFVEKPRRSFDTVINLNGDRMDCRADNLMWRPRWYAIAYHKQFDYEIFQGNTAPVICLDTNREYTNIREAAIDNGLYYFDIFKSCTEGVTTPITYQRFAWLEE